MYKFVVMYKQIGQCGYLYVGGFFILFFVELKKKLRWINDLLWVFV